MPKTYTIYLNNTLLCQTVFALKARIRELNNRPDLDTEILVHTQAALDLFCDVLDGKDCPGWIHAIEKAGETHA